jgi:hypothetical protein
VKSWVQTGLLKDAKARKNFGNNIGFSVSCNAGTMIFQRTYK